MSDRPTDSAKGRFLQAQIQAGLAKTGSAKEVFPGEHIHRIGFALEEIAAGLEHMATGLRATYLLLEKIERQQRTGRP